MKQEKKEDKAIEPKPKQAIKKVKESRPSKKNEDLLKDFLNKRNR